MRNGMFLDLSQAQFVNIYNHTQLKFNLFFVAFKSIYFSNPLRRVIARARVCVCVLRCVNPPHTHTHTFIKMLFAYASETQIILGQTDNSHLLVFWHPTLLLHRVTCKSPS